MSAEPVGNWSSRPSKLPQPYCELIGQRILVYKDEFCERYGNNLVLPNQQGKEKQPEIGTVVMVGDGFVPQEWLNYVDQPGSDARIPLAEIKDRVVEAWREVCPVKVNDRVMWSKYEDIILKLRVHPEWWSAEEIKVAKNRGIEEGVEFILLDVSQVSIISTSPEKELWQES